MNLTDLVNDMANLYKFKMQNIGGTALKRVHTTRFQQSVIDQAPWLKCLKGATNMLYFAAEDVVGIAAEQDIKRTISDSDTRVLAETDELAREQIFEIPRNFDGKFAPDSQTQSVPPILSSLVEMIMLGSSHSDSVSHRRKTVSLSISQLLIFNARKKMFSAQDKVTHTRHRIERETSISIYVAMKTHSKTQSKEVVDSLHNIGLCISYDRLTVISKDLADSVISLFEAENAPCPPQLREELLVIGSADNIDKNPQSRDAKDALHGTAIMLTQLPTPSNPGKERNAKSHFLQSKTTSMLKLPLFHTDIKECSIKVDKLIPPPVSGTCSVNVNRRDVLHEERESSAPELEWLRSTSTFLAKHKTEDGDAVSFAAFHAAKQPPVTRPIAITAILPIVKDKAKTAPMIKHAMKLVKQGTSKLNPGQTPIITLDLPLYAIAKSIQWHPTTSEDFTEDNYVALMGPLHTEMITEKLLGDWLRDSGWTEAIINYGFVTSGKADGILKASHITRARYCHEISAVALSVLCNEVYSSYVTECKANKTVCLPYANWRAKMTTDSYPFRYWDTALVLEMMLLKFVRSICLGDFKLYIESLSQIVPWCFILDYFHYARWLSVHIRDMLALEKHIQIYTLVSTMVISVSQNQKNILTNRN